MTTGDMTYAGAGVNYEEMDPFKRNAQEKAARTAGNAARLGVRMVEESRGESVYIFKDGDNYYGHVEEGLGTKNLVADEMYRATTLAQYYWAISQDAVAMIVNDMATLAVKPIVCAMHLAVGDSDWFKDKKRSEALLYGWERACNMAGCVWSCGETPTLKDVIIPGTFVLSGSAVGKRRARVLKPENIRSGNVIVFLAGSGIHANGLTLARKIANKLPDGYLMSLGDGLPSYGHALLEPTPIYCRFVEECLGNDVDVHYAVNITGHGWRKLMRAPQSFAYVVEVVPEVPPVLKFIQEHGPVNDEEAYQTFNMGPGFALYMHERDVEKAIQLGASLGMGVTYAGHIEESSKKKVIIKPKDITYDSLGVR